jgi:DNA (cytosine-5)-methyltransferase 1
VTDGSYELLRTPAASEAERGDQPEEKARARGGQVTLSGKMNYLPTVVSRDYNDRRKSENWQGRDLVSTIHEIEDKAVHMGWGKFEPAVKRWEEVTSMKAPNPTKPDGKDGAHRLSSKFTEWMMGLPEGWVTGLGLSRKDELKACGNGVVPQQAELALRLLVEGKK